MEMTASLKSALSSVFSDRNAKINRGSFTVNKPPKIPPPKVYKFKNISSGVISCPKS